MTPTTVQREILQALKHGALGLFELAGEIDQAPFTVRAELRALRRQELVYQRVGYSPWFLTERGSQLAWSDSQLRLA